MKRTIYRASHFVTAKIQASSPSKVVVQQFATRAMSAPDERLHRASKEDGRPALTITL